MQEINEQNSPRVSVYITSYNQKKYLIQAIDSVLSQTVPPYEIIIVDDFSSDGSQEIITQYKYRYPNIINPIFHSRNYGVAQSRTDALMNIKGDYFTFVDGDDRILPTKLEEELNCLHLNPSAKIAYSNYYYINMEGKCIGIWTTEKSPPQGYIFDEVFTRDFPNGALFRNELVSSSCLHLIDLYDHNLIAYEDWDFKIRLTNKFRAVYVPVPLTEYRRNPLGLSKLPASLRLQAMKYVFNKNYHLLISTPSEERRNIEKKISKIFFRLALTAVKEELKKGNVVSIIGCLHEAYVDALRLL